VVGCGKIFHGRYPDEASWHAYEKRGADPQPAPEVRRDPRSRSGGIVWGLLDVPDAEMNDHRMVDYAMEYLSQDHDRPFFLACGIFRPHMPWQVPRTYYEMFPLKDLALPVTRDDDLEDVPPAGVRMAAPERDHAKMLATGNWRHAVQAYLASIAFADAQVGRLLDALDASAHAKNTIVVLWGDHGWHLGEKEHWRKFALWEEAARAPLIIWAPGVTKPGTKCARTVDFMHVYPTLAELCDLPVPSHCEGRSLVPLLADPRRHWGLPAITTHGRGNHGVRSERYRYIRYANGDEELYDHEADPREWLNLAGDPRYDLVKEALQAWLPDEEAKDAERLPRQRAKRARRRPK